MVWYDGRHRVLLPHDHRGKQLERKQQSGGIIVAAVLSSIVAFVRVFNYVRAKWIKRRRAAVDKEKNQD